LGAFVTGVTVLVVLVAKFVEGAWLTLLFIPATLMLFRAVRRHYHNIAMAAQCTEALKPYRKGEAPIVVVPLERWNTMSKHALEFACKLSMDVIGVHVEPGEQAEAALIEADWERYVAGPYRAAGEKEPELKILASPYRFVVLPVVQFVLELTEKNPERRVLVVIPEMVEEKWYEYFLHNQRARLLEWVLLAKGNERIYTLASPYYLREKRENGRWKMEIGKTERENRET